MKNLLLPCLLVISLMTATAAQLPAHTVTSIDDTVASKELTLPTIEYSIVTEEVDEAFDFDTATYLPIGFDAYVSFEEKYGLEYEVVLEEEDAPFEFNTTSYLPVGFNVNSNILNSIVEIAVEEEDEAFDFDTKMYLPKEFNATNSIVVNSEI